MIYLARIGRLDYLKKFFEVVIIPNEVYEEVVVRGKANNRLDAFLVEKGIIDGFIKVEKIEMSYYMTNLGLHKGEAEAIALAKKLGTELLVDQKHAREGAKAFCVKPRGTIFVLLLALRNEIIDYDEYLNLLKKLVKNGFRMSDDLYLEAIELGKKVK